MIKKARRPTIAVRLRLVRGHEVATAMRHSIHLLLVHEMPGIGQAHRHGVEFRTFFPNGGNQVTTPQQLVDNGIYSEVAISLKGGPWRNAALLGLVRAVVWLMC